VCLLRTPTRPCMHVFTMINANPIGDISNVN
jgi:hypothetical protein